MKNLFKSAIPFAVLALVSFGTTNVAPMKRKEAGSVEEVVVTGSRISRTSNYDSTGPVEVFTAEDVISSGKTNIGDFLIELPSANLSSNATNQNRLITVIPVQLNLVCVVLVLKTSYSNKRKKGCSCRNRYWKCC